MSLIKEFQDVHGRPLMARSRNTAFFDFVIAERPIYIPNSGPPLEPISIMPAHDGDGVIEGEFNQPDNLFTYLVTFSDEPALRVSVKPQNIRDWVSARTLENWNLDEFNRRKEERQNYLREKENARAKKGDPSRATNEEKKKKKKGKPGRTKGRKRKADEVEGSEMSHSARQRVSGSGVSGILAGPARMRKSIQAEQPAVFTSPVKPQLARGPSLITPVKGLATIVASIDDMNPTDTDEMNEMDEAVEDEDDDEIIAAQLNPLGNIYSRSWSNTKTPGPSLDNQRSSKPGDSSSPRLQGLVSPDTVTYEDAVTHQISSQEQQGASGQSPFFSGRNPTAASSSRDALRMYENLERQKAVQIQNSPTFKNDLYNRSGTAEKTKISPIFSHAQKPQKSASPNSEVNNSPKPNARQPKTSSSIGEKYSRFWKKEKNKSNTMFKISKKSSAESPLKSVHKPYQSADLDDREFGGESLGEESEIENQITAKRDADGDGDEGGVEVDGDGDEPEWEVEKILGHSQRISDNGTLKPHYLIKWVGDWDDSWEPEENISQHLLSSYHARHDRLSTQKARKKKESKQASRNSLKLGDRHEDDTMNEDHESSFSRTPRNPRMKEAEEPVDPENQSLFVSDDETPRNKKNATGKEADRGGLQQPILILTSDSEDNSDVFAD